MPNGSSQWPSLKDNLSVASPLDSDTFATGLETLGQYIRDLRAGQNQIQTDLGPTTATPAGTLRAQVNTNATNITAVQNNAMLSLLNATPSITYNEFPDRFVVQRKSTSGGTLGKGSGTVALSLSCSSLIATVEYQLRDAVTSGNPVVKTYTTVAGFQTAGASGILTIFINDIPAGLGWFFLDVRINSSNSQIYLGTRRIGCGEVLAIAGSDLAVDFIDNTMGSDTASTIASTGVTPSAFTSAFVTTGTAYPTDNTAAPAWALVSDSTPYHSAAVAECLRLASARSGTVASLIGHAIGVSPISSWAPGQPLNTTLKSALTSAGGAFGAFLWLQGQRDAALGTSAASYAASLGAIVADLASSYPAQAFIRLVCSIPASGITTSGTLAQVNAVRQGARNYVTGDSQSAYVDGLDVTLGTDLFHPTQVGNAVFGRHFYRAWRRLRLADTGNTGPRLTAAARASGSANIALTVVHDKGTDLVITGASLNQFVVFASGDTSTPLSTSALTRVDATHLQLTLSAVPAGTTALDVRYRDFFYDTSLTVSNSIRDNWAGYGDDGITFGTQLRLLATPVTAAAPG